MVRLKQSPSRDFLIFIALYLATKGVLRWALGIFVQSSGASLLAIDDIVGENELTLQSLSMFTALLGVYKINARGTVIRFLRGLVPWPKMTPDALSALVSAAFMKGFLIASLSVGASLFVGLVKMEWPQWDLASFWHLVPALLFQALGLVFWLVMADRTVLFLRDRLVTRQGRYLESQILVIALVGQQLFRVFNGSPHLFDEVFTALVCALIAAGYLLWIEATETETAASLNHSQRAALTRLSMVSGFMLSLAHVYGQIIGGSRELSVMNLFQGPLAEPMGAMGLAGNCLFLLVLVASVNALLRRVLKNAGSVTG